MKFKHNTGNGVGSQILLI